MASIRAGLSECLMGAFSFTLPHSAIRSFHVAAVWVLRSLPSSEALAGLCAHCLGHTVLGSVGLWRARDFSPCLLET